MSGIPTYGELTPTQSTAVAALAALTTGTVPVKTAGGYADSVYTNAGATLASATAAGTGWTLSGTFAPTSGSDAYTLHAINLTVNQTGGANGAVTALKVNITETAAVGADYLCDYQIGGVSKWSIRGTAPITSAIDAVWDGYKASALTQSFKGATRIQTAAGINKIAFYAPTLTSDTATLTIDKAATLYISGPPIAGTNVAITSATSLLIAAGDLYMGNGNIVVGTSAKGFLTSSNSNAFYACGGAAFSTSSGAFFGLYGNTHSTSPGQVVFAMGNVSGSFISFAKHSTEYMRIDNAGNVIIGSSAAGATAAKCLALSNAATAPTASADLVHLYGADHGGTAASAALALYQEVATVTAGDNTADRYVPVTVNGVAVWLLARSAAPS